MLILSRKIGEQIRIAGDIVVVVTAIKGDRVSVGIDAPKMIRVLRGELQFCPPSVEGVGQQQICDRQAV
jgi:carbon storage regulator